MHAFAAAAGRVRDVNREESTELERWRAVHAEAMIRMLSDCGLRLGELLPLDRTDLAAGWLHVARTAHESKVQPGTKTTHHKREDEQGRDTPLPPTLEGIVRAMPPRINTRLLFPTPTGQGLAGEQLAPRRVGAGAAGNRDGLPTAGVPRQLGEHHGRSRGRPGGSGEIRRAQRADSERALCPGARAQRRPRPRGSRMRSRLHRGRICPDRGLGAG
jgi:integrase